MRPSEPSRLRYFCGRCISVIILYVCNVIREMPIYFPILLVRSPALYGPDRSPAPVSLRPLRSLAPVFLTFNVRMKIAILRTLSSWRVTLGNHQHAFQGSLKHFLVFLTYNVRMKNSLWCTFSSWRVTLGTKSDDSRRVIKVKRLIYNALLKIRYPKRAPDFS